MSADEESEVVIYMKDCGIGWRGKGVSNLLILCIYMEKNGCSMLQQKNLTKCVVFPPESNLHVHFAVSALVVEMWYGVVPLKIQ